MKEGRYDYDRSFFWNVAFYRPLHAVYQEESNDIASVRLVRLLIFITILFIAFF